MNHMVYNCYLVVSKWVIEGDTMSFNIGETEMFRSSERATRFMRERLKDANEVWVMMIEQADDQVWRECE